MRARVLSERILGGAFCPLNGQVDPLLLCRAFARGARRRGARIMLGVTVHHVYHGNGRVRAVRTSEGDIPCEFVVNAAGAWAADIGEMMGQRLPVVPARGQIVLTEPVPRFIHRVLSGAEPSARQTRRGNVIIGSTVEDAGFDKRVTADTIAHFAPGLCRTSVVWPTERHPIVGRPASGHARPQADHRAVPGAPGLCLAVGHSRRGICYAAGTGHAVAELIAGRPPSLALDAFRLSRFASSRRTSMSAWARRSVRPGERSRDAMSGTGARMAGVERGRALTILVDGGEVVAYAGESVAAALLGSGRRPRGGRRERASRAAISAAWACVRTAWSRWTGGPMCARA